MWPLADSVIKPQPERCIKTFGKCAYRLEPRLKLWFTVVIIYACYCIFVIQVAKGIATVYCIMNACERLCDYVPVDMQ